MSGPVNYDGIAMAKMYLFGTTDVPADFNERVRDTDAPEATITHSADQYLTSGPGRYAWPSRANIVERFFEDPTYAGLAPGTYSLQELQAAMQATSGYASVEFEAVHRNILSSGHVRRVLISTVSVFPGATVTSQPRIPRLSSTFVSSGDGVASHVISSASCCE